MHAPVGSDETHDLLLPDDADVTSSGTAHESFESMMTCLGLSERKPVPEPVVFTEPNSLGSKYLQRDDADPGDIVSTLSTSRCSSQ